VFPCHLAHYLFNARFQFNSALSLSASDDVMGNEHDDEPMNVAGTVKLAHYKGSLVAVKTIKGVVSTFTSLDEL
jgi:hypothetical protein